jgi:hypothetical protein
MRIYAILHGLCGFLAACGSAAVCAQCAAVRLVVYGSACSNVRQCVAVYGSAHGSVRAVRQAACGSALGSVQQSGSACVAVRQCAAKCCSARGSVWEYARQCVFVFVLLISMFQLYEVKFYLNEV